MIEYEVQYKESRRTVYLYQEWDVQGSDIVGWNCTKADVGKYIGFDDGSELYTKIVGVSDEAIRTEIGVFRRDDIVHCCVPKWPNSNYSGVLSKEEHHLVRPYSPREKGTVTRLINGENIPTKFITPRIKMLTIEKMKQAAEARGVDEDYIIGKIFDGSQNPNGKNFPFCIKVLARVNDIDIENVPKDTDKALPLFSGMSGQISDGGGNKDKVVMTNVSTIKSLIRKAGKLEEAEVVDGSE